MHSKNQLKSLPLMRGGARGSKGSRALHASLLILMSELAVRARVMYKLKSAGCSLTINQVPDPTRLQAKAYQLLGRLPVKGN